MKMFRYCTGLFVMVAMLSACSGSRDAQKMKASMAGNWTLQSVTTEGITGTVKTRVFNEADFSCFIGSTWNLISSNSMGSYDITSSATGCTPMKRTIRWSIYEPGGSERQFQFKRLDDKNNPVDIDAGFRLRITDLQAGTMQLKSDINFEGKSAAVVYNFTRQ